MRFEPKEITLRNGAAVLLRSPGAEDAAPMLEYLRACAEETDFLLRTPEECTDDLAQEQAFLRETLESGTSLMIAAFSGGAVVGSCQLSFRDRRKIRHRADVAIGLRRAWWGLGLGKALLSELIAQAGECGVAQLELEFIEGNTRAQGLYEHMGFRIYGERPCSIRRSDGTFCSEFLMLRRV